MNSNTHLDQNALQELKVIMEDDFSLLIETFIQDSEQRIDALVKAIEEGDAELLRTTAHSFKGSSSNICAPLLTDLCKDLESMGRNGNLSNASSTFEKVRQEFNGVKSALESMIQGTSE